MAQFTNWDVVNRMLAKGQPTAYGARVLRAVKSADALVCRGMDGAPATFAEIERTMHELRVAMEPYGLRDDQRPADPLHAEIVSLAEGLHTFLFTLAQSAAERDGLPAPKPGWQP